VAFYVFDMQIIPRKLHDCAVQEPPSPSLVDISTSYVLLAIFRDPDDPMRRSDSTIHPDPAMQLLSGPYNNTRISRSLMYDRMYVY
jgi:hypothetical protein